MNNKKIKFLQEMKFNLAKNQNDKKVAKLVYHFFLKNETQFYEI